MAAGEADLAYGITLSYSAAGSVYTELEDIDELGEPGNPDAPDVDITPLRNGSNLFRVFRRGLYKGGEFTFSQFYSASRMTALQTIRNLAAGTNYYWKITMPDGLGTSSTIIFQGYLKKAALKGVSDPDDPLVIMCAVTVVTDPVFTAGS